VDVSEDENDNFQILSETSNSNKTKIGKSKNNENNSVKGIEIGIDDDDDYDDNGDNNGADTDGNEEFDLFSEIGDNAKEEQLEEDEGSEQEIHILDMQSGSISIKNGNNSNSNNNCTNNDKSPAKTGKHLLSIPIEFEDDQDNNDFELYFKGLK